MAFRMRARRARWAAGIASILFTYDLFSSLLFTRDTDLEKGKALYRNLEVFLLFFRLLFFIILGTKPLGGFRLSWGNGG
ncbi:hypothetical protein BDP81DRAFT_416488 [Colletotrichum phormii]|uniref:Uncharacterized protein n=1 Tax=Colletotrichum phormii TaxID=359342 RepID=A0AAJ0A2K5_9PEZI|nr:uncharacterized protein BDP81DRAFT_416488 [Colletotrichum phormii]KAK1654788.1 hypothetical protein BDP81DRAFT_416488 [Colletotrichum phormii]